MKILVTGGRKYDDAQFVSDTLDALCDYKPPGSPGSGKVPGVECVIHGDAKGADTIAGAWARVNRIFEVKCPANWKYDGKEIAGPIRNKNMLMLKPDLIVAFPGGTGTYHMCDVAELNGFVVWKAVSGIEELTRRFKHQMRFEERY